MVTGRPDFGGGLLDDGFLNVTERHVGARGDQRLADRPADPLRPTRNGNPSSP